MGVDRWIQVLKSEGSKVKEAKERATELEKEKALEGQEASEGASKGKGKETNLNPKTLDAVAKPLEIASSTVA